MQVKLKAYPSQFLKRKKELVGLNRVSDIYCVIISPLMARLLDIWNVVESYPNVCCVSKEIFPRQYFVEINDEKSESVDLNSRRIILTLYIDPSLGVLKANFKAQDVEPEIYMNEIAMKSLGLEQDQEVVIKIGISEQIPELQRVLLKPFSENSFSKILPVNKNYVKEFISTKKFINRNSKISIPLDVFDNDTEYMEFNIQTKYLNESEIEWGRISEKTKIIFNSDEIDLNHLQCSSFWKSEQYYTLRSLINHAMKNVSHSIRSFLIYGAGGNGKSSQVFHIAKDLNVNVKKLSPSSLYQNIYQDEEGVFNLYHQLKEAESLHPCIFLIDEIDILFPDDEESKDLLLLNQLLSIFHYLESSPFPLCLVGITSQIERLDPFVKQKFEEHIMVDVPSNEERFHIFKTLLLNNDNVKVELEMNESEIGQFKTVDNLLKDISFNHFHGLVQADIALLCSNCIQNARMRQLLHSHYHNNLNSPLPTVSISSTDLIDEIKKIEPYSIRQSSQSLTIPQIPRVRWEDIGGLHEVKAKLNEMIVWPLKHYESYVRMGIKPPTGLLLYGPPGTGKTLIAKAVASASSSNFISINIPDLIKAEVGESEKTLAEIFRRARLASPCVIFFDEIQAIFGDRMDSSSGEQRLISQLLLELDSLENTEFLTRQRSTDSQSNNHGCVIVIAATNVPHKIDPTLLRPGRIEHVLYVGPPDNDARKSIFEMCIKGMTVEEKIHHYVDSLVERTNIYFSGADLANICQRAGLNALSRSILSQGTSTSPSVDRDVVSVEDFERALSMISPSLTKPQLQYYTNWELHRHCSDIE
ncbi:hypothetical protein C9374_003319 [Naegleria lovaniensis]|uniref:AAA+ ATPase domain-containing protein n=1 Tax=Naegleria lovaniensis TaxID=51637 RepID=A0AA88GTG9_NAELO|nr:uncharacterized protein C9374_003319 [Naegleria lovaniensis]KAG2385504.1 hypothetical protein C9374_003319 [Naegleria lovaniensis]